MSVEDYKTRIKNGYTLLELLSEQNNIIGINKLRNKIKQEIAFLSKIVDSGLLKKEHILCSNLNHYESLVEYLTECKDSCAVLEVFQFIDENGEKKRLCVDIVSDRKRKWTKVIARNPKALALISKGDCEFGRKSVIDQAVEYVACAESNLSFFRRPQVEFYFSCGIKKSLADVITDVGVLVGGTILECLSESDFDQNNCTRVPRNDLSGSQSELVGNKLNLDISTMLAYVSALTNGHGHIKLKGKILTEQAEREKMNPVKPFLESVFKDKELFCCEKAMNSFKTILNTLGGASEKERGNCLISRVRVVEDVYCSDLRAGGQVKERSLAIFGTGLALKAVTVTANVGFIRAAANQGVVIPSIIHQSRALTEQKEIREDSSS